MTAIQDAIQKLVDGRHLSPGEVSASLAEIVEGTATQAQMAALLVGLRKKGETVEEIAAFASTLRSYGSMEERPKVKGRMIDMCGTGGDIVKTVNVSTISSFVSAGAGAVVAKHGGRSVTSKSGSADVLEKLGFNIAMEPSRVKESIETIGIGFMFAPAFHPAMKHVAPVRKELGVRTVFNLMGPLINPARVDAQLLGLYSADLVAPVAKVLAKLELEEAFVVHGLEGIDEISASGRTLVSHLKGGKIQTREYAPKDLGIKGRVRRSPPPSDADEAAETVLSLLGGELPRDDEGRAMVLVNSAACLILAGKARSFSEGLEVATESIESGRAMAKLEELVKFSGGSLGPARERHAKKRN